MCPELSDLVSVSVEMIQTTLGKAVMFAPYLGFPMADGLRYQYWSVSGCKWGGEKS